MRKDNEDIIKVLKLIRRTATMIRVHKRYETRTKLIRTLGTMSIRLIDIIEKPSPKNPPRERVRGPSGRKASR